MIKSNEPSWQKKILSNKNLFVSCLEIIHIYQFISIESVIYNTNTSIKYSNLGLKP